MRNTVIPLYQPARLARLIPVMQSYVDALVANIAGCPDQDCIPFCQLSLRMAIDIIGKTAFGIEFGLSKNSAGSSCGSETDGGEGDDDVREFLKEYKRSMEFIKMDLSSSLSTILGLFLPCAQTPCRRLLRRVPGTADYKMDENERRLCRRIDAIIAGRRRDRAARRRGGDGDADAAARSAPLDFIAALLDAMENGGGGGKDSALEDRHVRALAYEHLIAGTKTTAFTLSSVVYLVSCHPRVEEKLLRELDGLAPPRGRAPTADELQSRFPYLDQVIKEAMRFHLVSPLIARQTSERVEIGGYVLPKVTAAPPPPSWFKSHAVSQFTSTKQT
jgi:carlactone C-19 oxidase